jgi:hypothetical protein
MAPTLIVATNVCVIGVIVAVNVKPPIDQRGLGQEGRSAITHIHDWTRQFSFRRKSCGLKIFSLAQNRLI